jgi:HEAT repeats
MLRSPRAPKEPSRPRRRHVQILCALLLLAVGGRAHADHGEHFAKLERATKDGSWRVRLQAAYVLARQKSPHGAPLLQNLLIDENDSVREVAATGLGELVGMSPAELSQARQALERATGDSSAQVRARAQAALDKLGASSSSGTTGASIAPIAPVRPHDGVRVVIGGVGAKPKNVSPDMTRRLRDLLVREFSATPELVIGGQPVTGFLIDSSITALSRRTTHDFVEVDCEISVIVGRLPSKAVVMMTSGGATVQEPRADFRPERGSSLEADALEGAVKGAHENLLTYLRRQR